MRALLVALLAAAAPDAPQQKSLLPIGRHLGGADTRCAACHVTQSWTDVRFNHEKTGFPLLGKHARVDCRGCHLVDFTTPVPRQCAACHRDAHAGDLGARCEACHDENTWKSPFNSDAHRSTAFPLIGAHGLLPCQECHAQPRDRKFSRATVTCERCHASDLTRTLGTGVDHLTLGFVDSCERCHAAFTFRPASFPTHDACMRISTGSHAAFSCEQCHNGLPPRPTLGACLTKTEKCVECHLHTHDCTQAGGMTPTDRLHANVQGYQCASQKCWGCHHYLKGDL